jgi:hypothetical protein
VERQNLTLRMGSKRFARLSNGFSKRLECHLAAVALHVSFYNLCRVHETLRSTPAMALGIADRVWSIGDLLDAALAAEPPKPTPTAPDRRRQAPQFRGPCPDFNFEVSRFALDCSDSDCTHEGIMIRKIIGIGMILAALLATLAPAYAQSNNGRPRGCYSNDGAHHLRGWCRRHGIQPA